MKKSIRNTTYFIRYILAFIISAVVTISAAAAFVMHFNDADTWLECILVFFGWIGIILIFGEIMFNLTHKIFKL